MTNKRITIKDIALKAGVSRGTVDRVLHNRGKVADDVKMKVTAAISALEYKPNIVARSLASKKTYTIATLLPNPEEDDFWRLPQEGISKALAEIEDFGVELEQYFFSLFDSQTFIDSAQQCLESCPDAILMATEFYLQAEHFFDTASKAGIPILCINTQITEYPTLGYIGQDSFQSGVLAGRLFDISCADLSELLVLNIGARSLDQKHLLHKEQGLRYYFDQLKRDITIKELDYLEIEDLAGFEQVLARYFRRAQPQGIFVTNSRAHYLIPILEKLDFTRACIIGFDMLPDNIQYLKENKIDFLINQDPEKQGELGIKHLFDYLMTDKLPTKMNYLPLDIVMKENYETYI